MKMQLKLILLLAGVLFISFMGCRKRDGLGTNIMATYATNPVPTKFGAIFSGTFTATGGVTGSGNAVMDVHLTDDSSFCTVVLASRNGSLTIKEACSRDMANKTGSWRIVNGTGIYSFRRGGGRLTMDFPPDVPEGVGVIENYTGMVFVGL